MPWTTDGECAVIYFMYSVSSVSNKQAALPRGRLPFFLTILTVPWNWWIVQKEEEGPLSGRMSVEDPGSTAAAVAIAEHKVQARDRALKSLSFPLSQDKR